MTGTACPEGTPLTGRADLRIGDQAHEAAVSGAPCGRAPVKEDAMPLVRGVTMSTCGKRPDHVVVGMHYMHDCGELVRVEREGRRQRTANGWGIWRPVTVRFLRSDRVVEVAESLMRKDVRHAVGGWFDLGIASLHAMSREHAAVTFRCGCEGTTYSATSRMPTRPYPTHPCRSHPAAPHPDDPDSACWFPEMLPLEET